MKIVLVGAFPPQEKGEAYYLGRYAREYCATYGDAVVLSQYVDAPYATSWEGIAVDRAIADRSKTGMSYAPQRELVEGVVRSGAELVHLHYGPNPDYGGRLGESLVGAMRALSARGIRTVLSLHSLWLPRDVEDQAARLGVPRAARGLVTTYFGWFQRRLVGSIDRVLCVVSGEQSPATVAFASAYGLRGLEEEVFPCEHCFDSSIAFKGTPEPLFFAFGFLRPDKGFDVLLRAFDRHVRAGGRGRLLICGRPQSKADEAYARELEALGAQLPADRCTIERRFLSDAELEERLERCSVVVIPYLRNVGPSMPLHQALGVGKPVIAARVGHNEALVGTVRFVEPNDATGLADALLELTDPVQQKVYAERSRATAQARSWSRLVRRHHDLYRSLVQEQRV